MFLFSHRARERAADSVCVFVCVCVCVKLGSSASSRPALLLAVSLAEKDALSAPLDCGHLLTEPASHGQPLR